MATKKTTTSKKSKAKSSKSTNKKTTEKSVSSAVKEPAKSAKKLNLKPSNLFEQIRALHIVSIASYLGLAVAAWFVMNTAAFPLTVGHLAKNELASVETTVFSPAVHAVYDLQVRYILIALLVISAIVPAIVVFKKAKQYNQDLKDKVNPWRWIDMAITGAITVELVALLNGVHDLMALKVYGLATALAAMIAWLVERERSQAGKAPKITPILAVVAVLLPWLVVAQSLIATYFYGMVRAQWFVYAASAIVLLGTLDVILNSTMRYKGKKQWQDYVFVERNFVATSFVTKVALAAILIVGLAK
jgi:Heliorhodopsin